jgi:plastocyanin
LGRTFTGRIAPACGWRTYSFTFTTPATYQYFCYLHPHMVGSIVVESRTGSNATQ